MPTILHGTASFGGIVAVESATYTCSHGITPGVCLMMIHPQPNLPDEIGNLVFSDGNETVVLTDCKIDSIKVGQDEKGFYWAVEILDRRWRWGEFGFLNGNYNQYDPFGKLLPWTIRSPAELATLCLQALQEDSFTLNLPPGLSYPGPQLATPIINVTGVNPPINWDGVPPAQALAQLADQFGCRVIYQVSTDSILISPIGIGNPLPNGLISQQAPALKAPARPDSVGVIGSPTRYQMRLALTAVGKEWDGSYRPINLLSYAPLSAGAVQIDTITITNPAVGVDWKVIISDKNGNQQTAAFVDNVGTLANAYNGLVTAINGNPGFAGLTAKNAGSTLTLTGKNQGVSFDVTVDYFIGSIPSPPPTITDVTTQAAVSPSASWQHSAPPLFPNVRATNRLTKADAQRLAQESVFRTYQLTGIDVFAPGPIIPPPGSPLANFGVVAINIQPGPINVPGYGEILRTQQLVLTDSQVDQISPQPLDPNLKDPLGRPFTVNFYNGYSRDKPAVVYGQVANNLLNGVWYANAIANLNTPAGSQVFVPFSVVPEFFLISFASPVFFLGDGGTCEIPQLTLQTAVMVRDPINNQLVSFTQLENLPGETTFNLTKLRHYPDVQVNVTSTYDKNNKLLNWSILEIDPLVRAQHYLLGMMQEFDVAGGQIVTYNGIRLIDLDGLTQQVTWSVGAEGCTTTASQNCEHSIWISPYPQRRRQEFLAAAQNVDEAGNVTNAVFPQLGRQMGPPGGFFPNA
jgi:hypothetical protein